MINRKTIIYILLSLILILNVTSTGNYLFNFTLKHNGLDAYVYNHYTESGAYPPDNVTGLFTGLENDDYLTLNERVNVYTNIFIDSKITQWSHYYTGHLTCADEQGAYPNCWTGVGNYTLYDNSPSSNHYIDGIFLSHALNNVSNNSYYVDDILLDKTYTAKNITIELLPNTKHFPATDYKSWFILMYLDAVVYKNNYLCGNDECDPWGSYELNGTYRFNRILFLTNTSVKDDGHRLSSAIRYFEINLDDGLTPATPNLLPMINLSYDKSACFDDNNNNIRVNLTIDSFDNESDTIYYSTQTLSGNDINKTIEFMDTNCYLGICFDMADFSFENDLIYNGTCEIQTYNFGLTNPYNPILHNIIFYAYSGYDEYMLEYNGQCHENDDSLYFALDNAMSNIEYGSYFLEFDDQEYINVSVLDYAKDKRNAIQILRNGNNLEIYDVFNAKILFYNETYNNFIHYSIKDDLSQRNETIFSIIGETTEYILNHDENKTAFMIQIEPKTSSKILQKKLWYNGNIRYFNWVPTEPTHVNINKDSYFRVYFTDENWINQSYDYSEIFIDLDYCKYTGGNIGDQTSTNAGPFNLLDAMFGQHLRNYYNSMGTSDNAKYWLWWVFIGLLIFFGWLSYKASNSFGFTAILLPSSSVCFLMAYFLQNTGQIITFLIFIALSLTPPIIRGVLDGR